MNNKFNNVSAVTGKVMAKLKTKWFELLLSGLTIFAANYILSTLIGLPAYFSIIVLGFMLIAEVGYLKALLNDEPVKLENLFAEYKLVFSGFLALMFLVFPFALMFLIFGNVVGAVLLVLPGSWFFATYLFSLNILSQDKEIGAIEAFKQSAKVSKGFKLELIIILAACVVIAALVFGISAFGGWIAALVGFTTFNIFTWAMFYIICMLGLLPLFLMIVELFYEQIESGEIKKAEKVARVKKPKKAKVSKAKGATTEEVKPEEDDIEIADID